MAGSYTIGLGPLVFEAGDGPDGAPAFVRISNKGPDGLPARCLFEGDLPPRFAEDLRSCARAAEMFQPDPETPLEPE